jgi:hypothetical protein
MVVAALFVSACNHQATLAPGVADAGASGDAVAQPEAGTEAGPELAPESAPDVSPDAGRDAGVEAAVDVAAGTDGRSPGDATADVASPLDAVADGSGPVYIGWPQPMCVWNEAYQENYAADTVTEILAGARGCYVLVDPFANNDARAAIAQMKQSRNLVSCYISVGTCEDWRDDFATMKPYCVSKQWGDWPGEYFVDRTDAALVALMEARIDKMAGWGCAMVEFDNMDWAFDAANRSQYGITATAAQGEAYNQTLCAYVHAKGLGCMAKSSAQGATAFDGLTVESAPDNLDWWNAADMRGMLSSGKIGIVVHYNETDCAAARSHYQTEYGSNLSFICEDRVLKKYRHFP